jgi:hypothetical protein
MICNRKYMHQDVPNNITGVCLKNTRECCQFRWGRVDTHHLANLEIARLQTYPHNTI